jgi:CRISPR type I-D-associated protein Csc1
MNHRFNLARLTCHDFLFYASRDYGASAHPVSVIGNYALMYALNRHIPQIRRVVTGTTPHYDEDLPLMEVYATPASPVDSGPTEGYTQVGDQRIRFDSDSEILRITWNSTGESLLWSMEAEKINIPKVGSYYKIAPLATFSFYTAGESFSNVIRIGKKLIPARIELEELKMEEKCGKFNPTCPVNVSDLPSETKILGGSLLTVPPCPLLLSSQLEGVYMEGRDTRGRVHAFPVPLQERYKNSWQGE